MEGKETKIAKSPFLPLPLLGLGAIYFILTLIYIFLYRKQGRGSVRPWVGNLNYFKRYFLTRYRCVGENRGALRALFCKPKRWSFSLKRKP